MRFKLDGRYHRRTDKVGQPYFVLKAADGQVIGTSEAYSEEWKRDVGISAVKTAGSTTTIVDLTKPS